MAARIGCVVEGHGEVESVPCLVRRIAGEAAPELYLEIPHPVRVAKSKILQHGQLERAVQLAALNAGAEGGVLVLLDSDDDCPAELGPKLRNRVQSARPDLPCAVVLAKREFESWFIAAAESLRGRRNLAQDLAAPDHPEEIRGAKEWLTRRVLQSAYSPTVDQAALTDAMDLARARRASPSFDKCYREVAGLLRTLSAGVR